MATPFSNTVASDSGINGKEEDENSTSSLPPLLHGGVAPAQAPTNRLFLSKDSMFGGKTLLGSGGDGATATAQQDQDQDHEAAITDGGGGLVQQQGDEVATAGGGQALLPSPHHQRRENAEGAASAEGQGGHPARQVPLGQQESRAEASGGELTLLSSALSSKSAANPTHSSPQEPREKSQEPTAGSRISPTPPAKSATGAANSFHQEAREESQEPTAGSEISPTLPGSASNSAAAGAALSSQEPQEEESRELIGGSGLSPTLPGSFEDVEAENPVFPPTEDSSHGTGIAPLFFMESLVSPQEEVNQSDSTGAGPVMPASSEENSLQSEYMNRLTEKDSTISELRLKEKELQQNLEDTENKFKAIIGEKEAEIEDLKSKVTDYQLRLSKAQKSHNAKTEELQSKIKCLEEELEKKEEEICRIKKKHEAQIESFKNERDIAQMELRMKEAIHEKERSDLTIEIMKKKLTIANMRTDEESLKKELAEERQKKAEKERDVVMERLNSVTSTSA